jgi:hypothetical protein
LIVVSDTSPILALSRIGKADLLDRIYRQVTLPAGVAEELAGYGFDVNAASWLHTLTPRDGANLTRLYQELDVGEAQAIALALQLEAGLLLIDERRGRRIARREGLKRTGVLGILALEKRMEIIPSCAPLVEALLRRGDFWLSADLCRRFLEDQNESP